MKTRFRWFCILFVCAMLLSLPSGAFQTKMKIAYCTEYPPYQFMDEAGNPSGLHVDIMNLIAKVKNLSIEYVPQDTDSACLQALDARQVDAVLGITADKYPKYISQSTDEFSSSNLSLFVPEALAGQLDAGHSFGEYLAVSQYMIVNPTVMTNLGIRRRISVGTPVQLFDTLLEGKVDIMVGDRSSLQYQIREAGMEKQFVIYCNYVGTVRYNLIVTQGDHETLRTINSGLAIIRANGEYDKLNEKWIINDQAKDWKPLLTKLALSAGVIVIGIGLYIIAEARVRRILRMQIKRQTSELLTSNSELEKRILQLEAEGELRNRLIQNSPNGMILFERDYSVTLMNQSALNIAGLEALPDRADARRLPIFGDILREVGEGSEPFDLPLNNRVVALHQNNADRSFRCSLHPVTGFEHMTGVLMSVEDITQEEAQKLAFFEQEKSQALSRIVAGIAHEIRNPLMSIRTFAALSKTKSQDHQFLDAFGEFVPTEVDRINKLVEGLINYARPARGNREAVALKTMVDGCLYLTRTVVESGALHVQVTGSPDVSVWANPDQLKQVLINVIMNSIESMEAKIASGASAPLHLAISVHADDGVGRIVVEDEGQGMPGDLLKKCADPFFTTKSTGTGLGLALCKQYIQENGGTLTIQSVEGCSTTVTIALNLVQANELMLQSAYSG